MQYLRLTISLTLFLMAPLSWAYEPWKDAANYRTVYEIDLSGLPSDERSILWVPLPAKNHHQQVKAEDIDSPWPVEEIVDSNGNRVAEIVLPQGPGDTRTLTFSYRITRMPSAGIGITEMGELDQPGDYLAAQRKIPLSGLISEIAEEERQKFEDGTSLHRGYYDYVYDLMTYSKEGEGWGEGDAIWACQSKYGNCTDFHSLYIGLTRSQGIASRFKIGFPLSANEDSGRHDGYHCWAETFDTEQGWIPLDASEAKKAGLRDEYYGEIPSDRIELTMGRDITLSPKQRGEPINYFVYPYAESESTIIDRLPVKFTWERTKD